MTFVLVFFFMASPVYAGGIGMFVQGGEVEAEWDGDYLTTNVDGKHLAYGFTVDSNLATDRLFNYRLEFGRSEWVLNDFNAQGVKAKMDGLVMNHDFGFGGLLTENVRFWFGPELRFTLLDGELKNVPLARDIDLFGYGVGAVAGLNYNLPGRLTIAAKGGFIMMRYLGRGPSWNGAWQSSDYDIDEDLVYVGVSMFFRTKS
jgi:hypothetical protein